MPTQVVRAVLAAVALTLLAGGGGCRTRPELREDWRPGEVYQTIANQLPRADLGWGDPPSIASMAASERGAPPPPPLELTCNERRLVLAVEVFKPRSFDVRYDAIEDVSYGYCLLPNLPCCFLFPFFQVCEARVVVDARKLQGFFDHVEGECQRLEQIAREIGFSGPYDHAMAVRQKLRDDARDFGEGRVSLTFGYVSPVPPWFPYTAPARRAAEAFAWVKAHPDEAPR